MPSIAPPAHTRGKHTSDDWITPKWIIDRFGPFDLDPCASNEQPWPCAAESFTFAQNGLMQRWDGFVWCNPPYGPATTEWLAKMSHHGNGIALVFARTETRMFFEHVWPHASAMLFLRGRLTFCYPGGVESKAGYNSGGPSVLIGYGSEAAARLLRGAEHGAFVHLRHGGKS